MNLYTHNVYSICIDTLMPTIRRISKNNKKTHKRKSAVPRRSGSKDIPAAYEQLLVCNFLETLHMIKLFHWKTTCHSVHKATCDLHAKLSENIDTFVETMMGKNGERIKMNEANKFDICDCSTVEQLKSRMQEFKSMLIDMSTKMDPAVNSDLLNIRDEMVGQINQFLYLLTVS
jgi:hypothetical protein